MSIPEVMAYLDSFEDELRAQADRLREFRYMLFESLDKDESEMLD